MILPNSASSSVSSPQAASPQIAPSSSPAVAQAQQVETLHAHEYINACIEGNQKEMTRLVKSYKDEHHFTRIEIEEDLKKAFTDLQHLNPQAIDPATQKAITKNFNKLYNATHGNYSEKKIPIKVWLLAGAFFTLGVIAIVAGAALSGGIGFIPGLFVGLPAIGFALFILGRVKKDAMEKNQSRLPINDQFEQNIANLSAANKGVSETIDNIDQLEALANNPSITPEQLETWKTELNQFKTRIRDLARENNLDEAKKEHKRNPEKLKELSEKRVKTTEEIETLLADLNKLRAEIPTADPNAAANPTPKTPQQELSSTIREEAEKIKNNAHSQNEHWASDSSQPKLLDTLQGSSLGGAQTQFTVAQQLANSIERLDDKQFGALKGAYGSENNFIQTIGSHIKIGTIVLVDSLELMIPEYFDQWLIDVQKTFPETIPSTSAPSASISVDDGNNRDDDEDGVNDDITTRSASPKHTVRNIDGNDEEKEGMTDNDGLESDYDFSEITSDDDSLSDAFFLTPPASPVRSQEVEPEKPLTEEGVDSISEYPSEDESLSEEFLLSPPGSPQASPLRPLSPTEEPQKLSPVSSEAVFNSTGDIDNGALSHDQFRSNSPQDLPDVTLTKENTVASSAPKARRSSSYADSNKLELASIENVRKYAQQLLKLLTPPYVVYSRLLIPTIDTYLKLFEVGSKNLKSSNGKKTAASLLQLIQKNPLNISNYFTEENPLDRLVNVKRALVDAAKDNLKKTIVDELIEILNDTVHEVIEKTPPELKLRSLEVLSQFYSELIAIYPNELQKFHEMLSSAVQQELEKNGRQGER